MKTLEKLRAEEIRRGSTSSVAMADTLWVILEVLVDIRDLLDRPVPSEDEGIG